MDHKKWGASAIVLTVIMLCLFAAITFIIDPFFHYHKPLPSLEYPLYDERHQSNGILRHFDYDAIMIGSSITANFKTSEIDQLFDVSSVKVPISAATFKEINTLLQNALEANPNIEKVFRSVDGFRVMDHKDRDPYFENPEYLLDNSIWNDVQYVFNKQVLTTGSFQVLAHTLQGKPTTNFDEYDSYMEGKIFGKEGISRIYSRPEKAREPMIFSEDLQIRTEENIYQNIISLAQQYPSVEFYCFFPPVSIVYFDSVNQQGKLAAEFEAYKLVSRQLLQQENIHLFAFFDEYDVITNLDNYMDLEHYHEDVNSLMLTWMCDGEHTLTMDNYEQYWDTAYTYYSTYDYDAIFQ